VYGFNVVIKPIGVRLDVIATGVAEQQAKQQELQQAQQRKWQRLL
jgi:hypothetical protein